MTWPRFCRAPVNSWISPLTSNPDPDPDPDPELVDAAPVFASTCAPTAAVALTLGALPEPVADPPDAPLPPAPNASTRLPTRSRIWPRSPLTSALTPAVAHSEMSSPDESEQDWPEGAEVLVAVGSVAELELEAGAVEVGAGCESVAVDVGAGSESVSVEVGAGSESVAVEVGAVSVAVEVGARPESVAVEVGAGSESVQPQSSSGPLAPSVLARFRFASTPTLALTSTSTASSAPPSARRDTPTLPPALTDMALLPPFPLPPFPLPPLPFPPLPPPQVRRATEMGATAKPENLSAAGSGRLRRRHTRGQDAGHRDTRATREGTREGTHEGTREGRHAREGGGAHAGEGGGARRDGRGGVRGGGVRGGAEGGERAGEEGEVGGAHGCWKLKERGAAGRVISDA
ncbi:uncharacterized protein B0H18DRAFT_279872 [Fomitopsis serialis]|uniref:uncharacterized protein n=1 Tax=Fomitopsis serialis TaxID=139415 RepID=UPI0020078D15|nr:uncharacterized protein B0H18DRAFT_279872 [Neoantrodia serialis]KAH9927581.1 hypothetical protein B0H18DRAFT_279872 [Neoantrodia serialis]